MCKKAVMEESKICSTCWLVIAADKKKNSFSFSVKISKFRHFTLLNCLMPLDRQQLSLKRSLSVLPSATHASSTSWPFHEEWHKLHISENGGLAVYWRAATLAIRRHFSNLLENNKSSHQVWTWPSKKQHNKRMPPVATLIVKYSQ